MKKSTSPMALFDSIDYIEAPIHRPYLSHHYHLTDIEMATRFLRSYSSIIGTFNAYRREVERFIHWCALIQNKALFEMKRNDIETFLRFSQKPPISWIGKNQAPRFIVKNSQRIPNPDWRPFIVSVSKTKRRQGHEPKRHEFKLSPSSTKKLLSILGCFYNYLLQESYVISNPVLLIRQKKSVHSNNTAIDYKTII